MTSTPLANGYNFLRSLESFEHMTNKSLLRSLEFLECEPIPSVDESRRKREEVARGKIDQKRLADQMVRRRENREVEMLRAAAKKRFNNAVSGLSLND